MSSAISFLICSVSYGLTDLALVDLFGAEDHPTARTVGVSVAILWLVVALIFHPENDWEIPEDRVFPWERWLMRRRATR